MHSYRQSLKNKKKDELPAFLRDVTTPPDDVNFHTKPKPSLHYLGPIFFGICSKYQQHAPPHSLKLASFHQPQLVMFPGTNNVSKLLYPQTKTERPRHVIKAFQPRIRRRKTFRDIYPHKAPGSKKMFVPEVTPHIVDMGKSPSIIEGEASVEIPFSRYPNSSSRHLNTNLPFRRKSKTKPDRDVITLSDIREQKRIYMSYKERIAHAHFPKEFATVRVIGPPIPASITITKLPSKRKTDSELTLELKQKTEEARLRKTEESRSRKGSDSKSDVKSRISEKSRGGSEIKSRRGSEMKSRRTTEAKSRRATELKNRRGTEAKSRRATERKSRRATEIRSKISEQRSRKFTEGAARVDERRDREGSEIEEPKPASFAPRRESVRKSDAKPEDKELAVEEQGGEVRFESFSARRSTVEKVASEAGEEEGSPEEGSPEDGSPDGSEDEDEGEGAGESRRESRAGSRRESKAGSGGGSRRESKASRRESIKESKRKESTAEGGEEKATAAASGDEAVQAVVQKPEDGASMAVRTAEDDEDDA